MKIKQILLMVLLLIPIGMLAANLNFTVQDANVGEVDFINLAIEYAKFTFLAMFVLAMNHIVARTFNFKIWWKTTLLPAILAYVGGLVIAALDIYATSWDFFVEGVVGVTDYQDFTNLALTGVVLVAFVKGLLNINKTQEKNAKRKAEL